MDFTLSPQVEELRDRVRAFMDEHVYPAEAEALRRSTTRSPRASPTRRSWSRSASGPASEGLWNLFLPDERTAPG